MASINTQDLIDAVLSPNEAETDGSRVKMPSAAEMIAMDQYAKAVDTTSGTAAPGPSAWMRLRGARFVPPGATGHDVSSKNSGFSPYPS